MLQLTRDLDSDVLLTKLGLVLGKNSLDLYFNSIC